MTLDYSPYQLGFYEIDNLKTFSKIEAIELEKRTGKKSSWNFNNEIFQKLDWTQEPNIELWDLYKLRAQQIRANPEAPGLERQPYAMTVRGEMPTQGAAAAANVRRGIVNRPFGNVAPEERALLEEERQRKLKNAIQLEAASRIRSTGGLQNYIRNWPGGTQ